jgi:hypothetical protein
MAIDDLEATGETFSVDGLLAVRDRRSPAGSSNPSPRLTRAA